MQSIMSSFELEQFVESPEWNKLEKLRKADLVEIAGHYKIGIDPGVKKAQVLDALVKGLVENKIVEELVIPVGSPDDDGDENPEIEVPKAGIGTDSAIRIKELELEKCKLELEYQFKFKQQELETQVRMRELDIQAQARPTVSTPTGRGAVNFDASRNVRLVPPFDERDVDRYFSHFEKVATSLSWPKEFWPLLLQSV